MRLSPSDTRMNPGPVHVIFRPGCGSRITTRVFCQNNVFMHVIHIRAQYTIVYPFEIYARCQSGNCAQNYDSVLTKAVQFNCCLVLQLQFCQILQFFFFLNQQGRCSCHLLPKQTKFCLRIQGILPPLTHCIYNQPATRNCNLEKTRVT